MTKMLSETEAKFVAAFHAPYPANAVVCRTCGAQPRLVIPVSGYIWVECPNCPKAMHLPTEVSAPRCIRTPQPENRCPCGVVEYLGHCPACEDRT